jgi:hypothetical protein
MVYNDKNAKKTTKKTRKNISMDIATQYVDTLVKKMNTNNLQTTNKICDNMNKRNIDVVFSSGAFNGMLGFGVGMYLKKLEEYNYIKVGRVSGSSIGSLIGLWYIMENNIEYFEDKFIDIMKHFRKTKNLILYQESIRKYVYKLFPNENDNMSKINRRLFISFYDIKKYKKRTVSKYKNREHLIDCLLRSSHIPYITDRNAKYKDRYIDGIVPFIFPQKKAKDNAKYDAKDNAKEKEHQVKNDVLIVNMLTQDKFLGSIIIKNDKNIYKKLITGVNDANQFFTTGKSDMCIYQKDLTYKNMLERSIFEIICFIILFFVDVFISIHCNSKILFSDSFIYDSFYTFFYNFFDGFIEGFLF